MTECPFQLNDDGLYQCPDCKWIYPRKADKPPRRNCPQSLDITEAADKLGITGDDIKHWAQALARWTRAGFPVRPQREVQRCLRICVACPDDQFVSDNPKCTTEACRIKIGGRCKACRCRVSTSSFAVANKLKMDTESCPKGHWSDALST